MLGTVANTEDESVLVFTLEGEGETPTQSPEIPPCGCQRGCSTVKRVSKQLRGRRNCCEPECLDKTQGRGQPCIRHEWTADMLKVKKRGMVKHGTMFPGPYGETR